MGRSTSGRLSAQADTHRLKHGAVMTLDSCDIDLDMPLFIMQSLCLNRYFTC